MERNSSIIAPQSLHPPPRSQFCERTNTAIPILLPQRPMDLPKALPYHPQAGSVLHTRFDGRGLREMPADRMMNRHLPCYNPLASFPTIQSISKSLSSALSSRSTRAQLHKAKVLDRPNLYPLPLFLLAPDSPVSLLRQPDNRSPPTAPSPSRSHPAQQRPNPLLRFEIITSHPCSPWHHAASCATPRTEEAGVGIRWLAQSNETEGEWLSLGLDKGVAIGGKNEKVGRANSGREGVV